VPPMATEKKIRQIAKRAASANLGSANFSSIINSTTTDSTGHDALRIVIVIPPGAATKIRGDAAFDTIVEIQDRLRKAGEERFPLVEFATIKELRERGND
jgi:hypothetical protein